MTASASKRAELLHSPLPLRSLSSLSLSLSCRTDLIPCSIIKSFRESNVFTIFSERMRGKTGNEGCAGVDNEDRKAEYKIRKLHTSINTGDLNGSLGSFSVG